TDPLGWPKRFVGKPSLAGGRLFEPLFKVAGVIRAHVLPKIFCPHGGDPACLSGPGARGDEDERCLIPIGLLRSLNAFRKIRVGFALDILVDSELPAGTS